MKGYFRIVKCTNNVPLETTFVTHGTGRNNKDAVKQAEKEMGCKFVYDGWIGNLVIYKSYLRNNSYYVLQIDRK